MKERVTKLLTREEAKGLSVSTFHTFGLNLLRLELKHTPLKIISRFWMPMTVSGF